MRPQTCHLVPDTLRKRRAAVAHEAFPCGFAWRMTVAALALTSVSALLPQLSSAQHSPAPAVHSSSTQPARSGPANGALVGTLGPAAVRALNGQSDGLSNGSQPEARRRAANRLFGDGYFPIVVADAPVYSRGGSTLMVEPVSPPVVNSNGWYPTMQPPTWRIVPDEHPVQAWRTVDVDDVVCNPYGACLEQTTRVLARWAPALRSYAFTDRVGRVWVVE